MLNHIVESVIKNSKELPKFQSESKGIHGNAFVDGFNTALSLVAQIESVDLQTVNKIRFSVLCDVLADLEYKRTNLIESISVSQRDSDKLASSGRVLESNNIEDSLKPKRNELHDVNQQIKFVKEKIEVLRG